jgi:DNA-binding IclR family transcriptional regulator
MLEREGFLQRELDGKRFVPGPRLNRLALSVIAGSGLRAERHAILHAVSTEIGETCNVTVPDGSEMHYVDRVETHWPLRLQFPIGTRVPLHCTASGKLFLSSLPNARRKRLLTRLALDRRTARTLTEPATLEAALMRIRKEQLGTDDEEFVDGMVAVAVPVTDPRGRLIATLATHAPRQRMTLEAARRHLPALRRAAAQLSELLGGGDAE